jgi:tetratricopeptide (TPR) repeat protein
MNVKDRIMILAEAEYLYQQARQKADGEDYDGALALLDEAVSLAPGFSVAHCEKGNCFHFMNRESDAIESYERAIEVDPYNAEAWFHKGQILKGRGNVEEGDQCIERATKLCCGR